MDRRERLRDGHLASVRAMYAGRQAELWTALPGILEAFDPAKVTATVQPAVQANVRSPKGIWNNVTMPLCGDVPVVFPGGGGFGLTFPLVPGDEGLIVFSARCADAWWQSGGIQPQAIFRMHSLSDGFFLPGVFSQPRVPAPASTSAVQLRANDGSAFLEIAPGGVCNMNFPGGINITGPVNVTGTITASGDVMAGEISLETHRHGGIEPGAGETSTPLPIGAP